MLTEMKLKRSYSLKERAKSQDETRQKIVVAAMELHEEIGPRATSISAIAERAGVQRLTVYRHFPTEDDVLMACSSHWMSLHPPPGPEAWAAEADARVRARKALSAFYAYFSGTRTMLARVHDDAGAMPALQKPMSGLLEHLSAVAGELSTALDPKPSRALTATLTHALAFTTWADLERLGLDDMEKTGLALSWIAGSMGTADTPSSSVKDARRARR